MRRELDDLDHAALTAKAVNAPEMLEERRKELRSRLRDDPRAPAAPKWTPQEMREAAGRVMAMALKNAKPMPS